LAIDSTLKDDINRLVDPTNTPSSGANKPQAKSLVATRGRSVASSATGLPAGLSIRTEVITVYSHLILTAEGAFERPLGWPTNGDYPPGTELPAGQLESLKFDAGTETVSLDTDVQYYEQIRVHLVTFSTGARLEEDHLLVNMAMPFVGKGFYSGLSRKVTADYSPQLYIVKQDLAESTASAINSRYDSLLKDFSLIEA
jgi:hypothetical protein